MSTSAAVAYKPLEDYGIVGNLETVALVGRDGSIDWCCLPHVESPSVFAAILDAERGGHFSVTPAMSYQSAQQYVDRTNVLETVFYTATGRVTVTDWMPFPDDGLEDPTPEVIYRKVSCEQGSVDLAVEFVPRFDYARTVPSVEPTERGIVARGDSESAFLSGSIDFGSFALCEGAATSALSLKAGETAWLALRYGHDAPFDPSDCEDALAETVERWQQWVEHRDYPAKHAYDGRWGHLLERSELVLKLLIHRETGAICAAPTTSLPEAIGGTRNWDYRFNWIRDSALIVQALYKLGHVTEARQYFEWVLGHVYEDPADIQPMYGLHGSTDLDEQILSHLSGYRNSSPVRVGNAAETQRQLDIYGELVLAIYETSRHGETITRKDWSKLRDVIDFVCEVWRKPDSGIWEVRSQPRHFVHSKVMCWVALDRGVEVLEQTDFEGPADRWREERAAVRQAVLERGFSPRLSSFVRSFGTEALDATSLLFPILGFLPFDDPRVQGTIEAVRTNLTTESGLVYRYDGDDGLPGGEGTFLLCSFWLVNALALSGRVEEASSLFESIVHYVNPLGLLAEEVDPTTGAQLGNFPQAFSHIGLVNSALYLNRARGRREEGPPPLGTSGDKEEVHATED